MRLLSDKEIQALIVSYARDHGIAITTSEGLAGLDAMDGFLSKLWSGIKKVAGPVLGIAAMAIPGLGPIAAMALKGAAFVASTAQAHHVAVNAMQDQQKQIAAQQALFTVGSQSAVMQNAITSPDIASQITAMGVDPNDPRIQTVVQQAALRQATGVTTVPDYTPWLIGGGILLVLLMA